MEYISHLEHANSKLGRQNEMLRREMEDMRNQLGLHGQRPAAVYEQSIPAPPNGQPHAPVYGYNGPPMQEQPRTLPSIVNTSVAPMQGVQYTDDRR